MIQIPQQENNEPWVQNFNSISPLIKIDNPEDAPVIPETSFKWFSIVLKETGDSEQEKKEIREAQMEQLKLGIISMQQQQPNLNRPQIQFRTNESIARKRQIDMLMGPSKKMGPNEKCICGSGKKYKVCCAHKYIK